MSTDDFNTHSSSPDPIHPAERSAVHSSEFIMNPPPVGRRLSAIAASISVLASLVVLAIAVPKGISEYSEPVDNEVTPIVGVKNSTTAPVYTVQSGSKTSTAISLGDRLWLAALETVSEDVATQIVFPDGSTSSVTMYEAMEDIGVAILESPDASNSGPALATNDFINPQDSKDLSKFMAVDAFDDNQTVLGPSYTTKQLEHHHDLPISNPECLNGTALLMNGTTINGIIVHLQHRAIVLGTSSIARIMNLVTSH